MNNKFKQFIIPAIAATIITGGATGATMVFAAGKDKQVEHREENDQKEQAALVKKAKITKEESIKIALVEVPGTVNEVELEDEDGTIVYGVEVNAKDGSQKDVKIDAQSGKIIKVENDDEKENGKEEENDQQEQADLAKKAKISKKESIKIALEKVPGTVKDVELEDEGGTIVYGIEVTAKDGSKQDVKVDVQTGKVIKIDNDDNENEYGNKEESNNE